MGDFQDFAHAVGGDFHARADLFAGGLAPVFLHKAAADAQELVYRLNHMHGDADGSGLVGYGAGDSLAYPPCSVCAEFVALAVVELFHGADEADVALLDEVKQGHSSADVFFGDADD